MGECNCGSGQETWPMNDGNGIFCTYVCCACVDEKRKKYRPEIMDRAYTEEDVCEPIEEEE